MSVSFEYVTPPGFYLQAGDGFYRLAQNAGTDSYLAWTWNPILPIQNDPNYYCTTGQPFNGGDNYGDFYIVGSSGGPPKVSSFMLSQRTLGETATAAGVMMYRGIWPFTSTKITSINAQDGFACVDMGTYQSTDINGYITAPSLTDHSYTGYSRGTFGFEQRFTNTDSDNASGALDFSGYGPKDWIFPYGGFGNTGDGNAWRGAAVCFSTTQYIVATSDPLAPMVLYASNNLPVY